MSPTSATDILVLNAGSSSIKFAIFDADLTQRIAGLAEGIGTPQSRLRIADTSSDNQFPTHAEALAAILAALPAHGLDPTRLAAVGHRVVHGGRKLTKPVRITPEIRGEIADCTPLAPLHNPHSLAAIDTMAATAPDLPQFASFDTSFHATNPEVATRYAIPQSRRNQGHPPLRVSRAVLRLAGAAPTRDFRRSAALAPAGLPPWQRRLALRDPQWAIRCHHNGLFAPGWADHGHAVGRD